MTKKRPVSSVNSQCLWSGPTLVELHAEGRLLSASEARRKIVQMTKLIKSSPLGAALTHTLNCAVSSGQQTFGAPFATQAGADP